VASLILHLPIHLLWQRGCCIRCWCGDLASLATAVEADDTNCNLPCGGDASLRCGGSFYADVYAIVEGVV